MTLPSIPPFAWFLGTPEERNLGGRVMLMWADSVLPYSVDPPTVPGWWDQPGTDEGQFQSWIRNFAADSGAGAKNFPNDREGDPEDNRFFNCVIPYMQGLKLSASAPKRLKDYHLAAPTSRGGKPGPPQWNESDGPGSAEEWPFRAEDEHALNFLEFYMDEFVDAASTAMIVALPVREVMNYMGATWDTNLYPQPDSAAGLASVRAFVKGALTKAKALGITILGWYLIDEPDFLLFNYWARASAIAALRLEVRKAEYEWRMDSPGSVANDPAFLAIPETPQGEIERQARLRPCVLTFSRDFGEAFPAVPPPGIVRREQPADYAAVHAADLYLFDWYPYRRSKVAVGRDWTVPCGLPVPTFEFLPLEGFSEGMTPKISIRRFRQMRRSLNPSGNPDKPDLLPGDPGYLPVALWSQGGGAVGGEFHNPDVTVGTPDIEPATLPDPDQEGGEGCNPKDVLFTRTKRMPTADEVRYYMWTGLFDLSEGFAVFTQFAVADNLIVQRFVPAAQELDYFQSLRVTGINKSAIYAPGKRTEDQVVPDFPRFLPVFWWARFGAPPRPLQGIGPEGLMEWLIVINRESVPLTVKFNVSSTGFPSGNWVLQEWRFLDRIDSSIILINRESKANVEFMVEPFRMRLFQLRRHKPATDPPFP